MPDYEHTPNRWETFKFDIERTQDDWRDMSWSSVAHYLGRALLDPISPAEIEHERRSREWVPNGEDPRYFGASARMRIEPTLGLRQQEIEPAIVEQITPTTTPDAQSIALHPTDHAVRNVVEISAATAEHTRTPNQDHDQAEDLSISF